MKSPSRVEKKLLYFFLLFFIPLFSSAAFLPPASSTQAMVSTEQHLATEVGLKIFQEGGNAIDAAVAVGYALAVVHPCCGNLGGGGFMLIHLVNGKNVAINFREKAPAAITGDVFFDSNGRLKPDALSGYLPVGIPGTVMGLNTALQKYGTLSLRQVMKPAIQLASQGFILTKPDTDILQLHTREFSEDPAVASIFLHHGKPYQPGERLIQLHLAKTLQLISEKGTSAFYEGPIAQEIVAASQQHGGVLSLADFRHYSIKITDPLECSYRGYRIITVAPPSSGVIVCEILNIVAGYPLNQLGFHSAETVHDNVEAMRYAFADRNRYLGDPDFVQNPVAKLLSPTYAKEIRSQIKPNQAGDSKNIGFFTDQNREKANTTHYAVIDGQGNAVSVTYTLNGFFGSKVIPGNTGFFLNNELDDFSLRVGVPNKFQLVQGKANLIQGNKRPLSSMSPTLVMKDNRVFMLLGAAGGSTIITTVVETIENVIDFGMDINAAVNQPRYHMQWLPDQIYREPFAFSADTLKQLQAMGYKTVIGGPYGTQLWGQAAAISVSTKNKIYYGAADNRSPAALAAGLHK